MDFGLDRSDPFGLGVLFLAQSLANAFDCHDDLRLLFERLDGIDAPRFPDEQVDELLRRVDGLLAEIGSAPGMLELLEALLRLGADHPPRAEASERLYRAVLWLMMRHDPVDATPRVLDMMRDSTPGASLPASAWPRHEFFATVAVLVCLGGPAARAELTDLWLAAQDLGYHDLAPILECYLDRPSSAPSAP